MNSGKYTVKANFKIGTAKTWATTDVDLVNDTIRIANHGFKTGDAVGLSTTGAVPTGLTALSTAYYIIQVDGSKVGLATSRANAFAGTKVNLTAVGSGVGTMQKGALGVTYSGVIIPKNHTIVNASYKVVTTGASPTGVDNGTLAITTLDTAAASLTLVAAAAISTGTTWDATGAHVLCVPDMATVGDYLTTAADAEVVFTTATDAWSAGEVNVYIDVVPALP